VPYRGGRWLISFTLRPDYSEEGALLTVGVPKNPPAFSELKLLYCGHVNLLHDTYPEPHQSTPPTHIPFYKKKIYYYPPNYNFVFQVVPFLMVPH